MLIELIVLFLIASLICIEMSFKSKLNFILLFIGGLILTVLGLLVVTTGIDITTGSNVDYTNATKTVITNILTNYNTGMFQALGIVLLGVGLYIVVSTGFSFINRDKES